MELVDFSAVTPQVVLDFETGSEAEHDAKKKKNHPGGIWNYAQHPSTRVWCAAYQIDNGPAELWTPDQPIPSIFFDIAKNPCAILIAHNITFEACIIAYVLARLGWPQMPIEQMFCTKELALMMSLPGALEDAARALNLKQQKEKGPGHEVMMRLANLEPHPSGVLATPEEWELLYEYCRQDVRTERELWERLTS
jgi:DNA polymerase